MSLDCYPFGPRRTIDLREQPIALDVAYDENLLITVIDNCRTIIVFDLKQSENNVIGKFQLGEDIVIDKVVYSKTGDYIASVGHNNGRVGLYTALNWRNDRATGKLIVEEMNLKELTVPFDENDRSDKLSSIDACQKTGNLVASYGDLVVIYQRHQGRNVEHDASQIDQDAANRCPSWLTFEDLSVDLDRMMPSGHFKHLVSVKLSMWASHVALSENYLSIMALDHVQVLKLEVLTLQIQSDGLDGDGSLLIAGQQQVNRSAGSSGDSHHQTTGMIMAARQRNGPNAPSAANETTVSGVVSASGDESSGSIVSVMTSNQSTRTNFSSFLATDNDEPLVEKNSAATSTSALSSSKGDEYNEQEQVQRPGNTTTDSDLSIITMNNTNTIGMDHQQHLLKQQQQQLQAQLQMQAAASSQDDCITWNLNTKKLVKLPTLMHNTSTDLSSFHICHPLELLGPASESIACRVSARIYSADLGQNQLEPVVLLCKQFDFDRDPVKLVQLQAIYLATNLDDQRRLSRGSATSVSNADSNLLASVTADRQGETSIAQSSGCQQQQLLKSDEHDMLAAVCCFVSTLTNCFIYSLMGKKVSRLQTITHPGLCLDLRADLLNVYLLTPLGLQVCSTSICDFAFRHDWSSSADLNLSFIACNRARVLATKRYLIMVSYSSLSSDRHEEPESTSVTQGAKMASFIEVLQKPKLNKLHKRIVQTIQCCQSISIRSNLLTYLQTAAQLEVIDLELKQRQQQSGLRKADGANDTTTRANEAISNLKMISLMLARQLLQKKQTNAITNGRIDKTIKHLLDNSYCDLYELMRLHLEASGGNSADTCTNRQLELHHDMSLEEPDQYRTLDVSGSEDEEDEEDATIDENFELIKIFLRHTKFNQSILDYLKSLLAQCDGQSNKDRSPTAFNRVVSYMFDYNPRLLIKCAQRITRELPTESLSSGGCFEFLVEQLKRLVKLDSTGINRATVLFTLAIVHHEMAAAVSATDSTNCQDDLNEDASQTERQQQLQEQCLSALSQIKPLNHLAITMCSNHEIISRSMAKLVNEHYPQVFKLFLNQLQKCEELLAAREFERLVLMGNGAEQSLPEADQRGSATDKAIPVDGLAGLALDNSIDPKEKEDDDEELFEQKLRLVAEISPVELAEFFCRELEANREADGSEEQRSNKCSSTQLDKEAIRAYLKASINLMESKFILARLCENSC